MGLIRVLLVAAVLAGAQPLEVRTATLANGMKLLVHEDHDIPNVALYFYYKIGSRNERPGTTGLSHYFEHMMFNGAKKYGPKQFDIHMEKAGGSNNAYTSRDVTVYTDWFPRTALELMFDMEADRIRDLSFAPMIIESERGVVASERRTSVDDNNFGALYEQLNATAFIAHPYAWPVIGWASDIESWTMEDLKAHFRMGYSPNNCVVIATGDVSFAEVLALARKHFEPIPSHEPPPPVRTREPEQRGERRVTLRKAAQLPLLMITFHTPATGSADWRPLQVLGAILAEGRSSRLYRRLVDRDQLAISLSQSLQRSLDPGQMTFTLQPRSGVEPARAEQALYEELERARAGPITAEEVAKARNQLLTRLYRQMKTIAGKADLLGEYEVFYGGYRKLFAAGEELDKVTPAQVQEAARRYLSENSRTVATLVPDREGGK